MSGVAREWREIPGRYNLKGTKCGNCGKVYFPARSFCPECRRASMGKMEEYYVCRTGKVFSFSVVHEAPEANNLQKPYVVAMVKTDDNVMITAQLVDVEFDKVEIVRVEKPENSYAALDEMIAHVEGLVNELGLRYRILRLCGGDMSFTSAITYDFELWSAAQGRWLEISSVSNFESYQANRLKLRYKDENGKIQLCHTLNGSSLALPRVVAALLEDNQKDRYIEIPEVLGPYAGFDRIG